MVLKSCSPGLDGFRSEKALVGLVLGVDQPSYSAASKH